MPKVHDLTCRQREPTIIGLEAGDKEHHWHGAPLDIRSWLAKEFFQSLRKSICHYLPAPWVDNEWMGLMCSGRSVRF